MTSRIAQLTIDVHDIDVQARFWSQALGLTADQGEHGAAKLYPPPDAPAPTIWLQPVSDAKRETLRLHLDLRPEDGDVESFTVLADPEGNEFCVLHRDPR